MPEYLAPGVYVEEVSFRSKSIEGVSTTTTGFIGPSRFGPVDLEPDIVTSLGEFERVYGDRQRLEYPDGFVMDNYLWHAARAFFEEGGKRLYVSRIFRPLSEDPPETAVNGLFPDGRARRAVPADGDAAAAINVSARFPGRVGNFRVSFTLQMSQSILGVEGDPLAPTPKLSGLRNRDLVWISDTTSPVASTPGAGTFYIAESFFDTDTNADSWRFLDNTLDPDAALPLSALTPALNPDDGDQVRIVTVTVTVLPSDRDALPSVWSGLALDPAHTLDGSPDSLSAKFGVQPTSLAQARTLPIVITAGDDVVSGLDVLQALLDENDDLLDQLSDPLASDAERSVEVLLEGGNDGQRPGAVEYEGTADDTTSIKTGLKSFEDIEDISIVAAPGSTFGMENGYRADATQITNLLISHASRMRYRIAVLDSGNGQSIAQVRAMRGKIDSTYAALYYPWVRVLDPVTRSEINLPPSGFVAGIYARNDVNRAVYKAPANEVVNLAIGFEQLLNKSQQDVLNPEGINCFRFFEGRGFRLWGARTVSSDPEWKYVNLRRYFAYLERSVDKGTQWAVFEPNGPQLWGTVRRTIEDFLFNEWQMGALLGDKPEKAFFVKCDRSTMTQNDLDNGRLICLIGVAPLRPAEFVIFRIGQWTADRKA
jgi:phage tail sheath protein FI